MVIDMVSMLVTFAGRPGRFEKEGEHCCCTSSARIFASVRIVGSELVRESLLIFERVKLDVAVAVVDSRSTRISRICSFKRSEQTVFRFHASDSGGSVSARNPATFCLPSPPTTSHSEGTPMLICTKKFIWLQCGQGTMTPSVWLCLVLGGAICFSSPVHGSPPHVLSFWLDYCNDKRYGCKTTA
jgi:hypothetical protein